MKDKLNNIQIDHLDIEGYEELMELVFAYTATAHDFGFTHKMNNRFTSLSMNASFLKQALENKDYEKALARATQVSDSISNLVKYSQELMSTDLINSNSKQFEFPGIISTVVEKLIKLPTFANIEIELDLFPEVVKTTSNPGIIWVFLYAFFKHVKRYKVDGPVSLRTSYDDKNNKYIIQTDVKEILKVPGDTHKGSSIAIPSAGEVPFRYLARVIRNVSTKFELIHRTERPLTLELKLTL